MNLFSFKSIKNYQAANGLMVDDIYGNKCKIRAALLENLEDETRLLLEEVGKDDLKFDDLQTNRQMASALQEVLHLLGYDINYAKYGADGFFGATSIAALDQYILDQVLNSRTAAVNQLASTLFKMYGGSKYFRKIKEATHREEECTSELAQAGLTVEKYTRSGRARVKVTDGETEKEFTQFKKGYYTMGQIPMSDLDRMDFDVSKSIWSIIDSVSALEGNMDAINTWDNSFMSLGMFQWTLGTTDDDGALGNLLQNLKDTYPETFEEFFLKYGLDVEDTEVTVEGIELTDDNKNMMREWWWCFRFWRAAQEEEVQAIMIEMATKRLRRVQAIEVASLGKTIGQVFSDSLTLAECLQIHVNRPAYLDDIVSLSVREAKATMSSAAKFLNTGSEFHESVLMKIRDTSVTYGKYPVTDALHRFDKVKSYFE